jgi:diguanylate cyclase (GGDEF)-like protein/PAS domain S-box-containing protein
MSEKAYMQGNKFLRDMQQHLLALVFLLIVPGMAWADENTGITLVVGSEQDYPPFAVGRTDETAGGFTVELWQAVAKETGQNYTIRVRPFRQILQEFKDGQIDVLINLAQSDERRQFVDFTVPHVTVNGTIFVRDGQTGIHTEADLSGKSIIVLNADLGHDYAIAKGWQKQLAPVDTTAEGFRLLASGQHDAMLISKLAGMQTLHTLNLTNIHAIAKAGFSQKFSFAVHKGQSRLLAELNEGLALTKTSGVYDTLYEKWFGVFEEKTPPLQNTLEYLAPIAIVTLGLAVFFLYKRRKERRQADILLHASEAKFRAMINASPVPFALNDAQKNIIFLNAAFVKTFGYTLKEIPTLADWWPKAYPDPDYRQWVTTTWQACLDKATHTGRLFEAMELNIRCKDGSFRTVMASAAELGASFKDTHLVILHDITEQVTAMTSLADSHKLLQTVIDTLPLRVFWKDTDSRYLGCNIAFAKDGGAVSAQDIIGKVDSQLTWREQAELYRADDRQVMNTDLAKLAYEEPQTTPEGKSIWLRTSKAPLHNADNKTIGVVGVYEDITERKQLELREQCYTQVLELLNNGSPPAKILDTIARSVEQEKPAIRCSIVLVDHDEKHLVIAAAPSLPDFYISATDSMQLCATLCSRGAAINTAKTAIVQNTRLDPLCQSHRDLAIKTGLEACWSEPVMDSSGKALGTITLHHHEAIAPTAADLKLIKHAAHLAAVAIEKSKDREALQLAALVYENSSEAIMITDADAAIIAHNPAFTELTGYTANEVIGKKSSILNSGRQNKDFYQAMWNALNTTGHWQGEIWNKRKNGEIYPEWLTINTIYHPDGAVHRRVALFSDISQKKQSEQIIWQQANFDPLTDLPNRRMFHDRLTQEMKKTHRAGLPLALMFLDLDHFKEINDTLGHNTGDLLLIETARRIADCVRESDTVARLGGDEFTVILSEIDDPNCVERIARNIVQKLSEPFQLRDETAYVSVSIGITLYPNDAVAIDDLLKHADQAMYASKNQGRNCYSYFTPSMQEAARNRMRLANDLRGALAAHQFRLFYQPIVELATGVIGKAEALIRWQHPAHGLISPAEFIPIAEETGMIVEIGDWVFREAIRQTAYWRASYHQQFQISINKSPIQFHRGNRHTEWFEYLQTLGLPGQSMVVEITEGLLLDAGASITEQLLEFRDAGIQVSLDDFGTGYSSLSYLKKFDIDYLKIDQSFVQNLTPHSDDMALCEAIIVMAHKLGIKVIAEGIETTKQRDLLQAAGCDYGQGYLFSRPVPADEFEALLGPR